VAAVAAIEGLRRIEREQTRRAGAGRHLAELELDRLVLADRLAKSLAHLRIFAGELQRTLRNADAARGDVDAAQLQPARDLEEAPALDAADQILGRQAIVLEHDLCRIDRLVAELRQLAHDRKAFLLRRNEETHAVVARLCLGIGLDQQREARTL